MKYPPRCRAAALLLIIGVNPLFSGSACAALGGDAASIEADAGSHAIVATSLQQYAIDEIIDGSGMRVREYLSRAGVVFAVAWSGPAPPDLQQLLGAHFPEYTAALAALTHPGLHRAVRIDSGGLVVEAGGHLRAYSGRAYLALLIPDGVPAAELR